MDRPAIDRLRSFADAPQRVDTTMRTIAQQQRTPRPPASAIADANDVFGSRKLLRSHAFMIAPRATIPSNDDGRERPVVRRCSRPMAGQRRRAFGLALATGTRWPPIHHSGDAPRMGGVDARHLAKLLTVAPNREQGSPSTKGLGMSRLI